jgi:FHA domain
MANELGMQAANISRVLLAIALWAASSLAASVAIAAGAERAAAGGARQEAALPYAGAQTGAERIVLQQPARQLAVASFGQLRSLIETGYQRAPVLIIVLSALLLLPVVALVSYFLQRAARRRSERAAIDAMARKAESAEWPGEVPAGVSRSIPVRLHEAWLVIGDSGGQTLPLAMHVTRIGRQLDNDLRLADPSVHRYHAVIERTSRDEFVITDLSGKEGNGIRINGERQERAHLVDGDVIELGRTRLKFESVPI